MGNFSPKTKGRAWIATIHVTNMINAGLTESEYKNPKYLADVLTTAWNDSGKNRTSGIAVCVSEKGVYHCHMALYGNTTTLSNVSKTLFNAHIEPQLGGKKELASYLKKDGKYAEKGEQVLFVKDLDEIQDVQGKRNDIEDIEDMLQNGLTPTQIMETSLKYRKFEKMIKSAYISIRIKNTPLIKDMNNEWHLGESGTGKTHYYVELCEKYSPENIYLCNDYQNGGFDFYLENGAPPIVFLDEFKGQINYQTLLTILDKYSRVQTHCRYQNTYNLWTQVIITSVYPPEHIYNMIVSEDSQAVDSFQQLLRRLNHIVYHYKLSDDEYGCYSIPANEYKGYADLISRANKHIEEIKKHRFEQIAVDEDIFGE